MTTSALKDSILSHLKYAIGKDAEHATLYDWRVALSMATRDRIVDPWFESTRATYRNDAKRVYYLSMEFLIGRLIEDVAVNLGLDEVAEQALSELGQDYSEVVADEPDAALGNGAGPEQAELFALTCGKRS